MRTHKLCSFVCKYAHSIWYNEQLERLTRQVEICHMVRRTRTLFVSYKCVCVCLRYLFAKSWFFFRNTNRNVNNTWRYSLRRRAEFAHESRHTKRPRGGQTRSAMRGVRLPDEYFGGPLAIRLDIRLTPTGDATNAAMPRFCKWECVVNRHDIVVVVVVVDFDERVCVWMICTHTCVGMCVFANGRGRRRDGAVDICCVLSYTYVCVRARCLINRFRIGEQDWAWECVSMCSARSLLGWCTDRRRWRRVAAVQICIRTQCYQQPQAHANRSHIIRMRQQTTHWAALWTSFVLCLARRVLRPMDAHMYMGKWIMYLIAHKHTCMTRPLLCWINT